MEKKEGFFSELSRRRVFRVAAIYIVGAWAVLQVSDLAFPGLQIPESAIRYVWIGVFALFPLALIIGWRFDIVGGRATTFSTWALPEIKHRNHGNRQVWNGHFRDPAHFAERHEYIRPIWGRK